MSISQCDLFCQQSYLQKDRSQIYCYWETQPGGCRKPHCAFKHFGKTAETPPTGASESQPTHVTYWCIHTEHNRDRDRNNGRGGAIDLRHLAVVSGQCEYTIRVRLYWCERKSYIASRWIRRESNSVLH